MPNYKAYFKCINGCPGKWELTEVIYRCPHCGNLLEVEHDIKKLKRRSPKTWKNTFHKRMRSDQIPYGSGVWGKKELVCPEVADENVVTMYEGYTNLFPAHRLGETVGVDDLWVKLCGNSHSGSFKDLGMTVLVSMVNEMIARGQNIPAVACASTGDTSAALACYCAAAGIQSIVFLPRNKISNAQLIQPIANGALTLALDTDFDGCMRIVQEITDSENIYLANSMNSLRIEGQKTVAMEIVEQFNYEVPDWIIIPGGNLGNVSALGKGLLMYKELGLIDRLPRVVCAQAAQANPLYQSYKKGFKQFKSIRAKKTLASAIQIGNPVSINKAIKTLKYFNGIVEQATENELANASALADRTGLFSCPHTGVALAAMFKLLDRGVIKKSDQVVVISTAHGLKFTEFKIGYHEKSLDGVRSKHANLPIELPADVDKVRKAIYTQLEANENKGNLSRTMVAASKKRHASRHKSKCS
jgi:threonine synthase